LFNILLIKVKINYFIKFNILNINFFKSVLYIRIKANFFININILNICFYIYGLFIY